jgi:hypothetical protein
MADEQDQRSDNQTRGFKVEDHRRFDADGHERSGDSTEQAASAQAETAGAGAAPGGRSRGSGITFSGFVVGLASQALAFLGALEAEAAAGIPKNIGEASALIDVLAMLQDKTRGNLAEDEERLMEEVLYDLRLRYVEEARAARQDAGERS